MIVPLRPPDEDGVSPLEDRLPPAEEPPLDLEEDGAAKEPVADREPDGAAEEAAPGADAIVPLPPEELRRALEAVLFSLSEPVSIRALAELFVLDPCDRGRDP